ncbi:MAG: methionine--tRNA ligase [Patescibacteria group bacterium]|mgnify:CR=1 FL=1
MKKTVYISTALPYVNSVPHLGFALEIIQADVYARCQRILDKEVFFLTGADENSLKNVRAAKEEGITTKELVNRNAEKFSALKKTLNLSFDDFIRTTENRHIKGAQRLWQACLKDIYKKEYKGLYCVGCEGFYKESELVNGLCPEHETKPELIEESNYFFKLTKYSKEIQELIANDKVRIIPESRKNEVLSFIKSGLEDICISRSAERAQGWGIPVPDDSSQIIWVWFDALSNYINALDYAENGQEFEKWWQQNNGDILHFIGKGILRFHAIYWLAMLISAGLNLPKTIFVHGYLAIGGQKMSKSLGNAADPFKIVEEYGVDVVRYFLLREFSSTEDGDFALEKIKNRYNADLANGLGNFAARVLALRSQFSDTNVLKADNDIDKKIAETEKIVSRKLEDFKFNEALAAVWDLIAFGDKYLNQTQVWKIIDLELKTQIIFNLVAILNSVAVILSPFLPETSVKITQLKKGEILFPRR